MNNNTAGGLLLLFFILAVYLLKGILSPPELIKGPGEENIFVAILGDISRPGVYGFHGQPDLKDLAIRAGGLISRSEKDLSEISASYSSGTSVQIMNRSHGPCIIEGEMSAFHKITLRLPLSLNRETLEGLTAISGIGPGIAKTIINERAKRKGFKSVDELMTIRGIGPSLYNKIGLCLVL